MDASFGRSWLHDPDLLREDLFVGGRWRSGGTGRSIGVTDPVTGDVIGQIAEADGTDVRDAIAAAEEAFGVWAGFTAVERARILRGSTPSSRPSTSPTTPRSGWLPTSSPATSAGRGASPRHWSSASSA